MIRDYCYVGDVVKANIVALDAGSGMAFNVGTGVGTKTQALFETIFDLAKDFVAIDASLRKAVMADARPGDLTRSCLDIRLVNEKMGWQPETDIRSGLEKTWKWKLNIL
jgi:UDP-glucose 4-epimerase